MNSHDNNRNRALDVTNDPSDRYNSSTSETHYQAARKERKKSLGDGWEGSGGG